MPAKTEQRTLATLLAERWEKVSRKIEEIATEIPAEQFEWQPAADVRTCGGVLRHVAFWNRYVADSVRGKEVDDQSNELSLTGYPTKASVLDALKRTSEKVTAALRDYEASMDLKTAELIVTFVEHTSEHYGQLV